MAGITLKLIGGIEKNINLARIINDKLSATCNFQVCFLIYYSLQIIIMSEEHRNYNFSFVSMNSDMGTNTNGKSIKTSTFIQRGGKYYG